MVKPRSETVELPTGKKIIRVYGADGKLTSELHQYLVKGWALSIAFQFEQGRKVKETYVCNGRIATRAAYGECATKISGYARGRPFR